MNVNASFARMFFSLACFLIMSCFNFLLITPHDFILQGPFPSPLHPIKTNPPPPPAFLSLYFDLKIISILDAICHELVHLSLSVVVTAAGKDDSEDLGLLANQGLVGEHGKALLLQPELELDGNS